MRAAAVGCLAMLALRDHGDGGIWALLLFHNLGFLSLFHFLRFCQFIQKGRFFEFSLFWPYVKPVAGLGRARLIRMCPFLRKNWLFRGF
jgi:hypothetical protein